MLNRRVCFFVIVLICGLCNSVFSQLNLYKEQGVEKIGSVDSFLEKNNFEYAVVAYSTSSRGLGESRFSCLVKQEGSWHLLQISTASSSAPVAELRPRPVIKQKKLTISQADSLLRIIEPQEGMKYTQEEFYALPSTCEIVFKGKKGFAGGFSDGATYHLAEKSKQGISSLSFYAPYFYLKNCLPSNAEYKIFIGMVNSVDKLITAANSI